MTSSREGISKEGLPAGKGFGEEDYGKKGIRKQRE